MFSSKNFWAAPALLLLLVQGSCQRSFRKVLTVPGAMLPAGAFNPPAEGSPVHGSTLFAGWAAHPSGIAFVAIYLDGTYLTKAPIGVDRPDVVKAFPQFKPNMVTGFNVGIDVSPWTPGPHQVIAKVVSKIGTDRDLPLDVIVMQ